MVALQAETVRFKQPRERVYELETGAAGLARTALSGDWLRARPLDGGRAVEFGRRVIVRFGDAAAAAGFFAENPFTGIPLVDARTFVFDTGDARRAVKLAQELALRGDVESAHPAQRMQARRHYAYAPRPDDPYYAQQWYLDPVTPVSGVQPALFDLNLRGAWPVTRGEGVTVALVDDGIDLVHPDLAANVAGPHRNFFTGAAAGGHPLNRFYHGTAVAGLAGARGDNGVGMSGVAPRASLAGWVIWNSQDQLPDEAGLASVFEFANDEVAVQNHSWGNSDFQFLELPESQALAISNAVHHGRGGRGVVLVRSAGNTRDEDYDFNDGVGDANLDGYANDLLQITVGAIRQDGRVASYSTPGACVLVAAPGGDDVGSFQGLFTTDPHGTKGDNRLIDPGEPQLADYLYGTRGLVGTSAAAPLVSGLSALLLSANPELGWRDVRQILALSARHFDLADPDVATNGAGFWVSHNVGYGVPDAGLAVRLALAWSNRPPWAEVRLTDTNIAAIPDGGFRVVVAGEGVPEGTSFAARGGTGRYPDEPTALLPLTLVNGLWPVAENLTGQGALAERAGSTFEQIINQTAAAGAAFTIIQNYAGTEERVLMLGTDFTRIPAAFINAGDAATLRTLITAHEKARVGLRLESAVRTFMVTNALAVENVRVRVKWQHPRQADLRVTLRSPSGTWSLLHRPGTVTTAPPGDWTFASARHLGESSIGAWVVAVTDTDPEQTGELAEVELQLEGVPIPDTDADGLDDDWELARLETLASGPADDFDGDGWSNAAEQLRGSHPRVVEAELRLVLNCLGDTVRVSWPGLAGQSYDVLSAPGAGQDFTVLTNLPGRFPEGALFVPLTDSHRLFRVEQRP